MSQGQPSAYSTDRPLPEGANINALTGKFGVYARGYAAILDAAHFFDALPDADKSAVRNAFAEIIPRELREAFAKFAAAHAEEAPTPAVVPATPSAHSADFGTLSEQERKTVLTGEPPSSAEQRVMTAPPPPPPEPPTPHRRCALPTVTNAPKEAGK